MWPAGRRRSHASWLHPRRDEVGWLAGLLDEQVVAAVMIVVGGPDGGAGRNIGQVASGQVLAVTGPLIEDEQPACLGSHCGGLVLAVEPAGDDGVARGANRVPHAVVVDDWWR